MRKVVILSAGAVALCFATLAYADIPAGYLGTPFDPAVVGGAGIIPPTVTAGPYAIPGRVDLVNYDMGGDGVGYHSEAHYTTKGGDGYRTDRPTTTLCLTAPSKPDLWYDTGTAQDGAAYPGTGVEDFYIGSIHPDDWFNYTVDVQTAGSYTLSSDFATGNGPPGGEGGDGQMEVIVFVNDAMVADWTAVFPDFQNKANFHNWKPYPNFATIPLEAGLQVIKLQLPFKHLNLDYIQFDLVGGGTGGAGGAGGSTGLPSGGSGGTVAGGGAGGTASAGGSSGGMPAAGGAIGSGGSTSQAGTTGVGGAAGAATNSGGSTTASAGGSVPMGSNGGATPDVAQKSGCSFVASHNATGSRATLISALLILSAVMLRRRRS